VGSFPVYIVTLVYTIGIRVLIGFTKLQDIQTEWKLTLDFPTRLESTSIMQYGALYLNQGLGPFVATIFVAVQ
jgi:hypothetical protein